MSLTGARLKVSGFFLGLFCHLALADTAVITNQLAGTVTLHHAESGELLKRLPMDGKPVGVSIDQQRGLAYISRPERGLVSVLDLQTREQVADILLKGGAVAIALDASGKRLAISDWYDSALYIYDTIGHVFITRIPLDYAPAGVVWGDDALYVAERDGDRIAVIDTDAWQVLKRIASGEHPFGLAYHASARRLYTADVVSGTVTVIDTQQQRAIASIEVDESPYCIAVSDVQGRIYVTNQLEDTVSVIDSDRLELVDTFDTDGYPEGISLSADESELLVANWGDSTVLRLDAVSGERLAGFAADEGSRAVGNFLYRE